MTSDADHWSVVARAIEDLPVRAIGPAFMGGRIADIAIHPARPSTWYLAVGSGGVWKTTNAGTTWTPVFDDQPSYSIGCVTVDPNNPDVVWVGTGEAVSGRHVGWGDGVYRSRNGGVSWQHMGLGHSDHIADILVDPRDSNVILVAAEGPLWSSGGDRGVFRSTDGGSTWTHALAIDADTGVTCVRFAADNPDIVYAASYQRRRRVWGFLGGGPGSGLYKSEDGGITWRRITEGLPKTDMGKIGLAVTPARPELLYATIEADEESRGFYRSTDRGESWERRNEYLSGGTGPHYYQEITASPTDPNRVYQVDVFVHWTADGGATFDKLETGRTKHSDNHLIWIDPHDGDHLLIGSDAGLYETFDHGVTFRHFPNLPISQFYRVAVDNSEPFYNILGGAQDLGTLYGPARTLGVEGVRNQDWTVTLGADGYHVAFDPADPAICYMEWQNGNVMRQDRRTMELVDIQPQGAATDPPERWNWDCPIVVSRHVPKRIYVGSQRVWRSDDRGDSWTPISGDLTRDVNRYELPTGEPSEGGRTHSVDALWDHRAMSMYSTITHLCESPVDPDVIFVGTDDGLVQITEDGGTSWRQATPLTDFPADGFINNVRASEHDADVVFVAADAHKNGEYAPFLFRSDDRGATWTSIVGDLPANTIVWSIQQDHIEPRLLFIGAEFGMYVSLDGGEHWHKIGKTPTISFRDIALHRQSGDLIGASFGRGFYVLHDYTPLRAMSEDGFGADFTLFPVSDAWWYVPHQTAQAEGQPTLGSSAFAAKNPEFGAAFVYHLAHDLRSPRADRRENEKQVVADDGDVDWPGWETLRDEYLAADPRLFMVIRDRDGSVVRRLEANVKAGLHRTTWDLRLEPPDPVVLEKPSFTEPWQSAPKGPLVAPGTYSVELTRVDGGDTVTVTEAQPFFVRPIPQVASRPDLAEAADFNRQVWQLQRKVLAAKKEIGELRAGVKRRRVEVARDAESDADDFAAIEQVHRHLEAVAVSLLGDPVVERLSEAQSPSIAGQLGRIADHLWETTGTPTTAQRDGFAQASERFVSVQASLAEVADAIDG